jgi:hypothetical protein
MKIDWNKMDSNVITILTKLEGHIWEEKHEEIRPKCIL